MCVYIEQGREREKSDVRPARTDGADKHGLRTLEFNFEFKMKQTTERCRIHRMSFDKIDFSPHFALPSRAAVQ